ncbi:MAG TPA: hypothetical protein VM492_00260 [Sumerlaeia bacterium]|nr:hypothetical protein [Sumerlaeia bacterium]
MSCKMALIGGGSCNWTPTLAKDLFLREGLKGGELVLVDIDPEAAELLRRYCVLAAERAGTGWTVAVEDLEPALDGASAVCISIQTGDLDMMHLDYTIPEEFGVYHTVADSVGPGGVSRSLRNIPVFLDIARKMERRCPNAWMVHVTNPLNQLTRAVAKETSVRCAGLCHNYEGTIAFLARFFGVDVEDVEAVSVGVNHGTWLKDITVQGKPMDSAKLTVENYLRFEARQIGPIESGTTDDRIERMFGEDRTLSYLLPVELFEALGVFPVGSAPHVAENLPFYLNDLETIRRHRIRRKGVLPVRREAKKRRGGEILDIVEGRAELGELRASREGLSSVVESLATGKPSRVVATMPNAGQVSNLPPDVVVETWARVSGSGISPIASGPIPKAVLGLVQQVVGEIELTVEAAVAGDRKKAAQAMYVSPLLHEKDRAGELADRLIEATKDYLPQFRR